MSYHNAERSLKTVKLLISGINAAITPKVPAAIELDTTIIFLPLVSVR